MSAAFDLATEIAADSRFEVIAIGRFVMAAELVGDRADQLPWGVSVVSRDDTQLVGRVWNAKDWIEFRATALAKMRIVPKLTSEFLKAEAATPEAQNAVQWPGKPAIASPAAERRDSKHVLQPSLFE